MLIIGDRRFLNLEEAVRYLMNQREAGAGFNIAGLYAAQVDILNPIEGSIYGIGTSPDYTYYLYKDATFKLLGNFKGPTGQTGLTGNDGATGEKGNQGIKGIKGDDGAMGAGIGAIDNLDLSTGEADVSYVDGIATIHNSGDIIYNGVENEEIITDFQIPIEGKDGIIIEADSTGKKIEVGIDSEALPSNLKNGIPLNSLKQKDTTFDSLNLYIRDAVIAYLLSLGWGLTQEQAEDIADGDESVEGSTKYVLAGLGITGDLTNTVYAALATAFGAGHTIGSPIDPQQGMGSVAMGMGLDITGKICLGVGKKQTYSVDMFTEPSEKPNARLFLVNLKSAGEFDTAGVYTYQQIIAGDADSEVLNFGTMSGDNSFMIGANNVKGLVSGAIGNANVIIEGMQNCFVAGTQNLVVGNDNFVSGLINYVGGGMNLVSGLRNKTSHSMCGAIGFNLETGADYQSVFGQYNLKNEDALLQVGSGSTAVRRNAFEVLKDGRAKVRGYPQDLDDVVRKLELNVLAQRVPEPPSSDGTYTLKCTVTNGVKAYQWIEDIT